MHFQESDNNWYQDLQYYPKIQHYIQRLIRIKFKTRLNMKK